MIDLFHHNNLFVNDFSLITVFLLQFFLYSHLVQNALILFLATAKYLIFAFEAFT
jgi:hypothetical protein